MSILYFTVSGICYGVASGSRTISYMVRKCEGCESQNRLTGGGSSFHIFLEELHLAKVKKCSETPLVC